MATVTEKRPASFQEFVELVEERQATSPLSLWFRGCGKTTFQLQPTLYRHRSKRSLGELELLERELMVRFRQRSIPFTNRLLVDEWDVLFFMQHYGIPTRLLDWTENPFIGLYFAVMSSPFSGKLKAGVPTLSFSSDAAVWMLDPVAWNKHALRHQGFDRGILSPADEALQSYKPQTRFNDMNIFPVAIYGAHNSPRIVAQRGAFTIFGKSTKSMEEAFDTDRFPKECLTKVIFEKDVLEKIRRSVLLHGTTESVVFPDLEGLAKEIKRDFEFDY